MQQEPHTKNTKNDSKIHDVQDMQVTSHQYMCNMNHGYTPIRGGMMGYGANSVYFVLPNDTKYVYCARKFLRFTEISCKEYTEDAAAATSIMNKAVFFTCPGKRSAEENINKILLTRTFAKKIISLKKKLCHAMLAIQRQPKPRILSYYHK